MSLDTANSVAIPAPTPTMLREEEAAHYLSVSLSTCRRWRRGGIGPHYFRIGKILRYSTQELDEFRARNTTRIQYLDADGHYREKSTGKRKPVSGGRRGT